VPMVKVRPIKTEADYEAALARADRLMDAEEGTPDADELDVLATLIEAYEDEHYPMGPPDPIDAIKFRMEQRGLTRKDLEPFIGSRTRVAEVLNRKRNLSIAMIRRLHAGLGIPAEVLLRPTRAERGARPRKAAASGSRRRTRLAAASAAD
jgi:HTH-type transcriptional regulator / antitoxin HigA